MATEPKERLHRLPDALPASELVAAERSLAFLLRLGYPSVHTFLDGPEAAQPQNKGDREAPAEGRRTLAEDGVVSERGAPGSGYHQGPDLDPLRSPGHESDSTRQWRARSGTQ